MNAPWGNAELYPAALPFEGMEAVLDALVGGEVARGLTLTAPRVVALDASASVPLVVGFVAPPRELAPRRVLERAVLVAVDKDGGAARAAAFAVEPPAGHAGEWDDGDDGEPSPAVPARGAVAVRLEAPAGLELGRARGRWVLTVLSGDHVSNPCDLDVVPKGSALSDGDAPTSSPSPPAPVWPPPNPLGGAPHYHRTDDSPPIPDLPGIVLVGPEIVSMLRGTPTSVVHGSFRVAIDPRAPRDASLRTHRLNLVVTGSDDARPAVVALQLPSFGAPSAVGEPTVTGHFMLDLVSLFGLSQGGETLHVRAFTGRLVSEALVLHVVT